MRLLILATGLFISCVILRGQQIELEPLGAPMGAEIDDFNLNKDGEILVFQKYVGFLFSEDSGQSWKEINSDFRKDFFSGEILPHPNGNFYITTESTTNNIFLFDVQNSSMDSIGIDSLGNLADLVIDESGEMIFLTEDGNLFISTDNGNTWELMNSLNDTYYFFREWLYSSYSGEYIYLDEEVNGEGRILEIPIDGGPIDTLNFRERISEILEIRPDTLLIGSGNGLILMDKQSGATNAIGPLLGVSDIIVTTDENVIIETTNGFGNPNRFFAIDNFGDSVVELSLDLPNIIYGKRIVFDSNSNSIFSLIVNASNSDFLKSESDFKNIQHLIPSERSLNVSSILKLDNDVVIVRNNSNIPSFRFNYFISYDSGDSFSPLLINGDGVEEVEIGGNGLIYAISENDIVYRSLDKGISWQNIHPIGASNIHGANLKAGADGYLFYFFKSGIQQQYYSEDGGVSWVAMPMLFFNQVLKESITIDAHGDIYFADLTSEVRKFNRRDWAWELLYESTVGFFSLGMKVKDSLNFFLYGTDVSNVLFVLSTNDAFQSVTRNQVLDGHGIPDLIKNRFFVSESNNEILFSQNGGFTWEEIFVRDENVYPTSISSIYIDEENYLYVGFLGEVLHKSITPIFNSNVLSGKVQIDDNRNCLNNSTEVGMPNIIVTAAGQDTFYVNTNSAGQFDILVPEGTYDLYATVDTPLWKVCVPLQTVFLSGANDTAFVDFSVQSKIDCPKLKVDLTTPGLRRCFDNTYYVRYNNEGTVASDTPFVKIIPDPRFDITQASIPFFIGNDSCYIFPLDTIAPFEFGNFSFVTEMDCNAVTLGETICAEAHIFPDSICGTPSANWSGASLESTAECIGDSIIFKIKNIGNGDMTQGRQFIIIEDVVIMRISPTFNLPSGDSLRIPIEATGLTYHLEVPQVDNHPGQSHPSVTVESCGLPPHSMGLFNQFPQNDNNPFIDIECREVIGAYDPNDKAAVPRGIDVEHKIQANSSIEYLIRFQNTGTDTAFSVNIIDTLSRWLDVPSFEAGASSHSYEYEISDQGTVRFLFNNIMLPDSNVNEPASNGFIKYKIAMKADLPIGTEILNEADIYFDFNTPIRTNETFHVIDEPWILVKTSEVFVPGVEVNAYPNPFQHQATIKLSNATTGQKKFRLFDLSGRQMRQQYFDSDQFIFEKRSLPNGVYFYEISGGGTKIAVGKLIVQ